MALVSHGVPVISSRQWTTALAPNGAGWNFIAQSYNIHSLSPAEWVVIHDLTGTPTKTINETISGAYANSNFQIFANNQVRALNGRIFFGGFGNYFFYYDPSDQAVHQLGPVVEVPPINIHASTIPFSATFDHAGLLYWATQESENRPSAIMQIDPVSLAISVVGYVGDSAVGYTTYGYYNAPDTITASKYIYVAYGQNPWQLWALNITNGIATKLADAPATGFISFVQKPEGWTAVINTDVGKPDNVVTQVWCIDGTTYPYVAGYDPNTLPFTPRNVAPASNPLVLPPGIDASGGIGVVGWRPNGSTGAYTYVNYTVNYETNIPIESLQNLVDGVLGNADQYNGFFRYVEPADTHTWFGAYGAVSQGARLRVGDLVYITGYPNGVLLSYDETLAWQSGVNPKPLGYYAAGGGNSGVKYADLLARSAASNRLYMLGSRERNGIGSGIGYYDIGPKTFAGTYANLDTVLPTGLAVMDSVSRVIGGFRLLTPPGTAQLIVYDQNLTEIVRRTVVEGWTSTGSIFTTSVSGVVFGIVQNGANVTVYRYNITTGSLLQQSTPIAGNLDTLTQRSDGSVWAAIGSNLVRFDIETLAMTTQANISTIAPVGKMAFFNNSLFMSQGATLWSQDGLPPPVSTPPSNLAYSTNPATYTKNVAITPNTPSSDGGAVVSYAVAPALPNGLALDVNTGIISGTPTAATATAVYTVTATNSGGSTNVGVTITVNSLAPANLTYSTNPAVYTRNVAITANTPSSTGGAVSSYSVAPALPTGLSLNTATGVITGTPTVITATANYTVTATNTFGSTNVAVSITVNAQPPANLTYSTNPAVYAIDADITPNTPSSTGGVVASYSVAPTLPAGLTLDTVTGVIFGKPTAITPATNYVVTATNAFGSTNATVSIAVSAQPPNSLTYSPMKPVYFKDTTITPNLPTSKGGAVASYAITPALPAGLLFDTVTGIISGTPTAIMPSANYTVTASNGSGSTDATLLITVNPNPAGEIYIQGPYGGGGSSRLPNR